MCVNLLIGSCEFAIDDLYTRFLHRFRDELEKKWFLYIFPLVSTHLNGI